MTYDPAVQALIDAVDAERLDPTKETREATNKARERLRPKPEMEKVLTDEMPKWYFQFAGDLYNRLYGRRDPDGAAIKASWIELVTLTMRRVQKQKWKLWNALSQGEKDVWNSFLNGGRSNEYDIVLRQILSMNEETP